MAAWDLLEEGRALRAARRPFALATVVRRERPASAQPGDQALITLDGRLSGWIGGSCAEPIIIREARRVMREGRPCLVRLGPPDALPDVAPEGMAAYPMTCHSGGTLEIFVDPCLPAWQAVLVGHAPVIQTLATLAAATDFDVIVCAPGAEAGQFPQARQVLEELDPARVSLDARTHVVVSTHGERDEEALATALRGTAGYVALVASPRRAAACRARLLELGLDAVQVARLAAPAGLDLGATTPAEIAAGILAEMVRRRHGMPAWPEESMPEERAPGAALDPVCGMTVAIEEKTPMVMHEGRAYYFCSRGCRDTFARDPQRASPAATEVAP